MSACSGSSFKRESDFYILASQARALNEQNKSTNKIDLKLNQRIYALAASIFKKIWSFVFTKGQFEVGAKEAWNQCFKGNRFTINAATSPEVEPKETATEPPVLPDDNSAPGVSPGSISHSLIVAGSRRSSGASSNFPAPTNAVRLTRTTEFRDKFIEKHKGHQFGPEKWLQYDPNPYYPLPATMYLKATHHVLGGLGFSC